MKNKLNPRKHIGTYIILTFLVINFFTISIVLYTVISSNNTMSSESTERDRVRKNELARRTVIDKTLIKTTEIENQIAKAKSLASLLSEQVRHALESNNKDVSAEEIFKSQDRGHYFIPDTNGIAMIYNSTDNLPPEVIKSNIRLSSVDHLLEKIKLQLINKFGKLFLIFHHINGIDFIFEFIIIFKRRKILALVTFKTEIIFSALFFAAFNFIDIKSFGLK